MMHSSSIGYQMMPLYMIQVYMTDILTPYTFHKGKIHGLHLFYTFLIPF